MLLLVFVLPELFEPGSWVELHVIVGMIEAPVCRVGGLDNLQSRPCSVAALAAVGAVLGLFAAAPPRYSRSRIRAARRSLLARADCGTHQPWIWLKIRNGMRTVASGPSARRCASRISRSLRLSSGRCATPIR